MFEALWRALPPVQRMQEANARLGAERESLLGQRDALEHERDELAAHCARLTGEIDAALEREGALAAESGPLFAQRDALESERDQLRNHAARLSGECDEANRRAARLAAELQRATRSAEAERERLLGEIGRIEQELEERRRELFAPPGHFYSPVVDPKTVEVPHPPAPPAVDDAAILATFERVAAHYSEIPWTAAKQPGLRYWFENPAFSYGDAIALFGILLELRPKRMIEAGSGYSSCAAMDTNDRFLSGNTEFTFIDPYPDTLFSLLEDSDRYRTRVRPIRLQDAPAAWFEVLEPNDILFIDSSHVLKTGSDVHDYLFRILPLLRPGVVVHVHDILYPFEYGRDWIVEENRSWNEAYALRALLEDNPAYEILYWNDYVFKRHRARLEQAMPLAIRNAGGSIWLRKKEVRSP